jgi:hypothetical protein
MSPRIFSISSAALSSAISEFGMIFTNFELSNSEHMAEDIFRLVRIFGFLMQAFDARRLPSLQG